MDYINTIISLLEKYSVPYWTEGKNVSNSVNIQCPLCTDQSNHCGIFRDSTLFHCWKCGQSGDFAYLLSVITHRPKELCQLEIIQSSDSSFIQDSEQQILKIFREEPKEKEEKWKRGSIQLPKFFEPVQNVDSLLLQDYIKRRKLSLETLIEHKCGICCVGEYMNRLIAPIFFEGKLIGFQAADMTGKAESKYKADTKDSEIKQYFYRWDMLDRSLGYVIIVEGLLDAWRLGGNTLASFGTALTEQQKRLLIKLKPKKLIFAYDGDAYFIGERESQYFMPFIDEVFVIQLPYFWKSFTEHVNEDPDSWGAENVWQLIKEECLI